MKYLPVTLTTLDIEPYKEKLTKPHYAVLYERALGKGHKQIARDLNIPLGTVKSRLNRAEHRIMKLKYIESLPAHAVA